MKTNYSKIGVIVNCEVAPLQEKPLRTSLRLERIPALTEVHVYETKSIGDYWYIRTRSGEEGYCLKEYIVLRG